MADSEQDPPQTRLRTVLGLPASAASDQLLARAQRLRSHIEERIAEATSESIASARRSEVERLREGLEWEALASGKGSRGLWIGRGLAFALGAALASAILIGIGGLPNPDTEAALNTPGRISVVGSPAGAIWRLIDPADDRVLGEHRADGMGHAFSPGGYRLEVAHADCPDEWLREITLLAGAEQDYAPELCQGLGEVVVEASAEGARLQIDGMDVGSTGAEAYVLSAGPHTIRVEKTGFAPWKGEIQVEADARLNLRADLAPGPSSEKSETAPALGSPSPPAAPEPTPARIASGSPADPSGGTRGRRERTGKGGSKSWHDAVKHQLVIDYDRNGSRSLDTPEEIQGIPCPVLLNLEASYETGGLAVGMIHLYGFDGSAAPANTLGVTSAMRGYAYDRMKDCGLRTRR